MHETSCHWIWCRWCAYLLDLKAHARVHQIVLRAFNPHLSLFKLQISNFVAVASSILNSTSRGRCPCFFVGGTYRRKKLFFFFTYESWCMHILAANQKHKDDEGCGRLELSVSVGVGGPAWSWSWSTQLASCNTETNRKLKARAVRENNTTWLKLEPSLP
jgi:hypothetical protein